MKLAREIALAKPAYISQGWGPQRHANGELVSRAIAMLPTTLPMSSCRIGTAAASLVFVTGVALVWLLTHYPNEQHSLADIIAAWFQPLLSPIGIQAELSIALLFGFQRHAVHGIAVEAGPRVGEAELAAALPGAKDEWVDETIRQFALLEKQGACLLYPLAVNFRQ